MPRFRATRCCGEHPRPRCFEISGLADSGSIRRHCRIRCRPSRDAEAELHRGFDSLGPRDPSLDFPDRLDRRIDRDPYRDRDIRRGLRAACIDQHLDRPGPFGLRHPADPDRYTDPNPCRDPDIRHGSRPACHDQLPGRPDPRGNRHPGASSNREPSRDYRLWIDPGRFVDPAVAGLWGQVGQIDQVRFAEPMEGSPRPGRTKPG